MSQLRIAVAGAGLIGRRHIELIEQSRSCRLAAITDPAAGVADTALKAGVPLYPTLGELLARERPGGVIIASPNNLHVEQGLECVTAGVPALIEKPIADKVEDAVRLCEAAERANVPLLVGHHRQHSSIMEKAREIVRGGELGRLVGVLACAMFYKPDHYFDEGPWRRVAGGGPILINMIHEIGNLRALCGEIVAVQAFASSATRGFPVEDTVAINLSFAQGALGSFLLSDTVASGKSWEQTSREDPSFPTYPDQDCYVVVGTGGSLAIPTMRLTTFADKSQPSWWKPLETRAVPLDRTNPLERQLAHFCAVIRGETKPLVTARDGLQNLRIAEAIATAVRTKQAVATV